VVSSGHDQLKSSHFPAGFSPSGEQNSTPKVPFVETRERERAGNQLSSNIPPKCSVVKTQREGRSKREGKEGGKSQITSGETNDCHYLPKWVWVATVIE